MAVHGAFLLLDPEIGKLSIHRSCPVDNLLRDHSREEDQSFVAHRGDPGRSLCETPGHGRRIAIVLPNFRDGGVERSMCKLAEVWLACGWQVELALFRGKHRWLEQLPEGLRVRVLRRRYGLAPRRLALRAHTGPAGDLLGDVLRPWPVRRSLACLPELTAYLRDTAPELVVTAKTGMNVVAVWARRLAGARSRLLVSEHTPPSARPGGARGFPAHLVRRAYPDADAIIAVSHGLADDLAEVSGPPRSAISVVYNPVVDDHMERAGREPVDHPWFAEDTPVILGAGRLAPQKDFGTLLRAFALARRQRPLRLVVLGDGPERRRLQALARDLEIAEDVDFRGYEANPYRYMSRARAFVLSSRFEGLGRVLIEALACGCPAVSTDCPSGPREILADGALGPLVPVGDARAVADAIGRVVDDPPDRGMLARSMRRFGAPEAAAEYLRLAGVAGKA